MIQNTVSKCYRHQKSLISLRDCSDCLFDELKEQHCGYMHSKMLDLIKNGFIEMQQEMREIKNNATQSIEQIHDNVKLIGQMKDGYKHGDFYYQFDDGTKEYAGIFEQNQKEGIWQEFVSFTYEVEEYDNIQIKRKRMKTSIYNQGNQLRYQQVKGQIYMEKIGLFNQLLFEGKLVNNQKMGLWQILYKKQICGGGYYDDNGSKIGQWTEVCEKYNNKLNVTYKGEYKNGIRIGKWTTSHNGLEVGGGQYDVNGVKSGKWRDIHDNYWNSCQVTYLGEYKNGIKIGKWATSDKGQEIGGGLYDEKGVKSGQWRDIHDNYYYSCQVTYQGEYKNGIRIGKWATSDKGQEIGGGQYDEKGVKSGQWRDIHDNYRDFCQVTYQGEYKNGIRIGKWLTSYKGQEIGGGQYDEKGVKSGQWRDIHDNYRDFCQVTYQGEYKNGIRIGKWATSDKGQEIGGGQYDEKGVKSGQWRDIHANYYYSCQVTYQGEYKNGIRIGKWATSDKGQEIGGGQYDEKGVKSGQWRDIHDNYRDFCQVTYQGEYKNGIRIGKWATSDKGQEIGGGQYDEKGVKSGQWRDIHDNYYVRCQVTYQGEYKNGIRIGKWTTSDKGKEIGGGQYDEKGVKSSQWRDIHDNYEYWCQVTYQGEYKNGIRIGQWTTSDKGKEIGGGQYDEKGVKSGQWRDIHDNYYVWCQVTYQGEYKNGIRIGKWITSDQCKEIGGGQYDEKGVKSGKWREIDDNYSDHNEVTYYGEYKNGIRIGGWTETKDNVTNPLAYDYGYYQ